MKVHIVYIRHGFSCANAIQYLGKWYHQYKRLLLKDPPLTQFARDQIRKVRGSYPKQHVDVVCASTMLRAIETACELFPRRKITVVPYVKERGRTAGNVPLPVSQQKAFLPDSDLKRIDFEWADHQGAGTSHHHSFKVWLSNSLPLLLQKHGIGLRRKEVTIALVTHSQYMEKFLGGGLPKNLAMIAYEYEWEKGAHLDVLTQGRTLFEGVPTPTKADFEKAMGDANCR
jgi:broad specificity phosphatase PhoE